MHICNRMLVLAVLLMFCSIAWAHELPRLVVQTGHGGQVTSVAFSPDGRNLVSGGMDGMTKLWDVASGREIRTLGGQVQVTSVAFSPDGKLVASGSWGETIKIWEISTGRELYTLTTDGVVTSLSFSPNGQELASGTKTPRITIWDIRTGKPLHFLNGHKSMITSLAFAEDGHSLASVSLDSLVLWDTANGHELRKFYAQGGRLNSIAVIPHSPNFVVAGSDGKLRVWDVLHEKELRVLEGHTKGVHAVGVSYDGQSVASISSDKTVRVWSANTGDNLRTVNVPNYLISDFDVKEFIPASNALAISPDGTTLAWGESGRIVFWNQGSIREIEDEAEDVRFIQHFNNRLDMQTFGQKLTLWDIGAGKVRGNFSLDSLLQRDSDTFFAMSGDEKLGVSWGGRSESVGLFDGESFKAIGSLPLRCPSTTAISADGKLIAAVGACLKRYEVDGEKLKLVEAPDNTDTNTLNSIGLWDAGSLRKLHSLDGHWASVESVSFSPDGRMLVSGGRDRSIRLWDVSTGLETQTLRKQEAGKIYSSVLAVSFSPDGKTIAAGTEDNFVELWDVSSGQMRLRLEGHLGSVHAVAFSLDGKYIYSAGEDKATRLWRVSDGAYLATLYSFKDGSWVVIDPEGRFDTADLEEIKQLHWVMSDDPLTPVPLESFMKEYYEPRLLPRILNGEKLKPVSALMELNRVQPQVKIISVTADSKAPEFALISVEVAGAKKDYERDGKKVSVATAANDLRLFRDGQLVGYVDGKVADSQAKPYQRTFSVRLPSNRAGQDITFSAYAFNDDRVKSSTARANYHVPGSVVARKGRAYIVSIGVNQHDNPAWNLKYAANDARIIYNSLANRLKNTGKYEEIISIALVSDETEHRASKAMMHAVIDRLAGKPASPTLKGVFGTGDLLPATPDDLVVLTFSGHGHADAQGNFYVLTQDTGAGNEKIVNDDLRRHNISSEELSQWIKDVDAGDMTMVVDACQSAASVQGEGFKPGPMGSRGLGQLSFDKGMRILAASQADEYALENDSIKQGLLSFALVSDGLDAFNADRGPKDGRITLNEWLNYAVSRVPQVADEIRAGKVLVAGRGERSAMRVLKPEETKGRPAQQPALFDFSKNRREVEIAVSGVE